MVLYYKMFGLTKLFDFNEWKLFLLYLSKKWVGFNKLLLKKPNAIEPLETKENKIDWSLLSSNPNKCEPSTENKINWILLFFKPSSENKINCELLSSNQNKTTNKSSKKNKIDWAFVSSKEIDWMSLSIKTNGKYDYKKMKETMKKSGIAEELMAHIFNPKNMDKWIDWGFGEHQEMIDFMNNI